MDAPMATSIPTIASNFSMISTSLSTKSSTAVPMLEAIGSAQTTELVLW